MPAVSTMMLTSLVAIGEKTIDGTFTSSEQTFYLNKMNSMLDSWSVDRTLVYAGLMENFSLTTSTASYTIGSGGVFNTARPNEITNAFIRDASNYDTELEVISQDSYDAIKVKTVGTSYPQVLFYDPAYPLGTIYLYPTPAANLTLYIRSWKQLQSFASVTTALALPPGYQRAIESNFAIECAPGLTSVSPELAKIAKESLAAIRSLNLPDTVSRFEAAVSGVGRGNVITGP